MNNDSKARITDPDLWIRLLYMILFAALTWLSRLVLCVIGLVQFLVVLISGAENRNLRDFSASLAEWTFRAFRFICFNSEQKPFPFDEWPEPDPAAPIPVLAADATAPAEQSASSEVQSLVTEMAVAVAAEEAAAAAAETPETTDTAAAEGDKVESEAVAPDKTSTTAAQAAEEQKASEEQDASPPAAGDSEEPGSDNNSQPKP